VRSSEGLFPEGAILHWTLFSLNNQAASNSVDIAVLDLVGDLAQRFGDIV